MKFITNAQVNF